MLARNFKTAHDLRIEDWEHEGLIKVLGMLERGELEAEEATTHKKGNFLNMGTILTPTVLNCGTVGCIGGWACHVQGKADEALDYVMALHPDHIKRRNKPLQELFYGKDGFCTVPMSQITVDMAAQALRNYLTIGRANWVEVFNAG